MFIETIEPHVAEGQLDDVYTSLAKNRGKIANIYIAQSLNAEAMMGNLSFYIEIMFGSSPLKRYQREMLAVVVASINECNYTTMHHVDALSHYWKDENKMNAFVNDYKSVELGEINRGLCSYAEALSLNVSRSEVKKCVDHLKQLGASDREILDATLIISYHNFQVRMVKGLGVELEPDGGVGYLYD